VAASFAQSEKHDLLGIDLVRDNPYQIFTRAEMAGVKTELGRQVDAVIDAGERLIPRFTIVECAIVDIPFSVLIGSSSSGLKPLWTTWRWERVMDYCVFDWLLQTKYQSSPVRRFL